jgi:hypothetical protein
VYDNVVGRKDNRRKKAIQSFHSEEGYPPRVVFISAVIREIVISYKDEVE